MDTDYYISIIDLYSQYGVKITAEQQKLLNNLEQILSNHLRDDYGLLCNLWKLYKSTKSSVTLSNLASADCAFIGDKVGNKMRVTELLGNKFGLSEKTIYNYLKIADKFIDFLAGEKFIVLELKDYSISKLQELLPLSIDTIRQAFRDGTLTYKSTRAEIRQFVKSLQGSKKEKVIDNDQPNDIDPDNCYNVSIEFPKDIFEFVRTQVLTYKKYASLEDYIFALIRKEM